MGLGIEKRIALLSDWITDLATVNLSGDPPLVTANWYSHTKRWTVRLHHGASVVLTAEAGGLVNAMRCLWTMVQARWPQ